MQLHTRVKAFAYYSTVGLQINSPPTVHTSANEGESICYSRAVLTHPHIKASQLPKPLMPTAQTGPLGATSHSDFEEGLTGQSSLSYCL